VTTGSGDSRTVGGTPRLPEASQPPMTRSASVMPETLRPGVDGSMATPGVTAKKRTLKRPGSKDSATTALADDPTAQRRPMTVGTAPITRKKGRRARLTVKRIDPWTTLKFSFVYGLAGMIVLLVTVVVLYSVVDAMGVLTSVRNFITTVNSNDSGSSSTTSSLLIWLSFKRVLLVAVVIGGINVILFTAFATLTAFIYNVCTDIVGGVEVTLAERN
jgi:Transmembrane domain of unknown function (DUF3566)